MKKKTAARKSAVKKMRILVEYLIDRSGSMAGVWTETLNGFKVFVNDLKKDDGVEYFLSLTCFDTLVEQPLVAVPIGRVDPMILGAFPPRGGTALYDALGATLKTQRDGDFTKVICVVVTDGEENSSQTETKDSIHTLIDSKLASGKHTFQYFGAQPETWSDAKAIGLSAGSTYRMDVTRTGETYTMMSNAVRNFANDSTVFASQNMTRAYADPNLVAAANLTVSDDDDIKP